MPRHRQRQVLAVDAAAVIRDAQPLDAALHDVHVDLRGPGIERVLEQFLQCRGRPLHHFAGRNLVDQQVR